MTPTTDTNRVGTGVADLIGIAGDTTGSGDNYTLDLAASVTSAVNDL